MECCNWQSNINCEEEIQTDPTRAVELNNDICTKQNHLYLGHTLKGARMAHRGYSNGACTATQAQNTLKGWPISATCFIVDSTFKTCYAKFRACLVKEKSIEHLDRMSMETFRFPSHFGILGLSLETSCNKCFGILLGEGLMVNSAPVGASSSCPRILGSQQFVSVDWMR